MDRMDGGLDARVRRLEQELARARRRGRRWTFAAVSVLVLAGLGPALGYARTLKQELVVVSAYGTRTATLTPDGLVFEANGTPRFQVDVGDDFGSVRLLGPRGNTTWSIASSASAGTSLKIFSAEEKIRLELAESLLDSGAGVRLYDPEGYPRATFFAERRGGESGLELTDADRQPRIDIYARRDGVSVLRASDSSASALAEISVLPESDALYRYSGILPEPSDDEALVPMVYLEEPGARVLNTPRGFE